MSRFLLLGRAAALVFLAAKSIEISPFDHVGVPPLPATSRAGSAETLWFDQRLDHFNSSSNATWKQRYFRNTRYHVRGGPVMLFINDESEATGGYVLGGFMASVAAQLGGLCLLIEHRYYGQSRPSADLTTENLRFLSAQQALGDVANFVRWYRQQSPNVSDVPWVVFGGSYAGNLAAWARLKYPDLITAAVSSSAPVQANITFPEYLEVVGEVLGASDPECLQDIRAAVTEFEDLVKTQAGADKVSQYYRLCRKLNISRPLDVANLEFEVKFLFSGLVQSGPLPVPNTVRQRCASIRNMTGTPLQRAAQVTLLRAPDRCLAGRFEAWTDALQPTDYTAKSRQWTYQTCSQFGYFQTMESGKQPFGHLVHPSYFEAACTSVFGEEFNLERTRRAVAATNAEFGGRQPNVTNVVFVNGGLDPWHRLGVLRDLSDTAVAVFIPDTTHCTDMLGDLPGDSVALRAGRTRIRELVTRWTRRAGVLTSQGR